MQDTDELARAATVAALVAEHLGGEIATDEDDRPAVALALGDGEEALYVIPPVREGADLDDFALGLARGILDLRGEDSSWLRRRARKGPPSHEEIARACGVDVAQVRATEDETRKIIQRLSGGVAKRKLLAECMALLPLARAAIQARDEMAAERVPAVFAPTPIPSLTPRFGMRRAGR